MLVAVLVTFGVLTKQNEMTAFKACGVSLHRLALPILLASGLLSAGLFAFDYYYVPGRQPQAGRAAQRDQGPRRRRPTCGPTASGSSATARAFTTTATSTPPKT